MFYILLLSTDDEYLIIPVLFASRAVRCPLMQCQSYSHHGGRHGGTPYPALPPTPYYVKMYCHYCVCVCEDDCAILRLVRLLRQFENCIVAMPLYNSMLTRASAAVTHVNATEL